LRLKIFGKDMREQSALLALEDATLFYGRSHGFDCTACGELVFNTSMTGYQEVCTDPSYAGQIVLFTASHIGNVGANSCDLESAHIAVRGVIAREVSKYTSSWRSEQSFISFLQENNIAWIENIDTRALTRHVRDTGEKGACIMVGDIDEKKAVALAKTHHPCQISSEPVYVTDGRGPKICLLDFGVKQSVLNILEGMGYLLEVVNGKIYADEVLAMRPNGIVLSNGPGDPAKIDIGGIRRLLYSGIPMLGICLGCQLIALAGGGSVKKMRFGHHGTNHPVYDCVTNKVYITSQNHNYVVDVLSDDFEVTHRSLFDDTIEGIRHREYPVIGFQGHPEGGPGPKDIRKIFDQFVDVLVREKDAIRSLN